MGREGFLHLTVEPVNDLGLEDPRHPGVDAHSFDISIGSLI